MLNGELNPNHPVTMELRSEWHKIAAFILAKLGRDRIDITSSDIEAFQASGKTNIVIEPVGEVIHIKLVDDAEAVRLTKIAGGQPA